MPAGVQAVLEYSLGHAAVPAIGLWARVPHYLSGIGWPVATLSLIEGVEKLLISYLDKTELVAACSDARSRVDELFFQRDETCDYVTTLESINEDGEPRPEFPSRIPTTR